MANTKWEYKKIHFAKSATTIMLNEFGKEGWELCHNDQAGSGTYYYTFKRPILDSVLSGISGCLPLGSKIIYRGVAYKIVSNNEKWHSDPAYRLEGKPDELFVKTDFEGVIVDDH